jgi:hypothetical protein
MIEGPFPGNNSFAAAELDASLRITLTGFGKAESRVLEPRGGEDPGEGEDLWKR